MNASTFSTLFLSVALAGCSVGAAENVTNDGQQQGNLAGMATLAIDGQTMTVESVDVWLPYQYTTTDGYYQLFIKFSGPGYDKGSDFAINVSDRGIGCHLDPSTGAPQQVWLRPAGTSEYVSDDGSACGLTVSAIPASGGRLTGKFLGPMKLLNEGTDPHDVQLSFDAKVTSATVTIGGVPMTVTGTDLWPPDPARDNGAWMGFVRFNGPGYPSGSDVAIDLYFPGSGCVTADGKKEPQMVWLRPDGAPDQYMSTDGPDCGLFAGTVGDLRATGRYAGDTVGLNTTGTVPGVEVIFDLSPSTLGPGNP